MYIEPQFIVFASSYKKETVEDILKTEGISFKNLEGCYKGQTEDSYIVCASHFAVLNKSGLLKDEESILLLGTETKEGRHAQLLFMQSFERVALGFLKAVSKDEALASDAYTYRPDVDTYYLAS